MGSRAAAGLADADTRRHGEQRAEHGCGEVEPEGARISADDRGREGAGGIHGCAANRAGEHRFERDDCADGDAGGDAFFLRAGGDAEDDEHEEKGEDDFEDEGLGGGAGGERGAEGGVCGEERAEEEAGGKGAAVCAAM